MATKQSLTSKVLMSICVAATVSFFSCSDELTSDNSGANAIPANADTALLEAYGLTYENFIDENDVLILNADTTQLSVSKALADKLGITSFVNHPMGIWHKPSQLPYTRKATAEKLVGDRYILTVKPATVAEIVGNKKVTLNTGLYVNPDAKGGVTRAGGLNVPGYAAKYMDENDVIHPAVIQMTSDYDYDKGYHLDGDKPKAVTRASEGYQYVTAEQMLARQTRASVHRRILSFRDELEIDKNFQCGENEDDSINVNFVAPIDFELNYFITLDGGVKWHVVIPEPYVERFEAGIDGKFAFSPELRIGFKKEWKLDEDKWKKKLASFNGYTFTFWVGPVPVSIKCEPGLFLKIDGKVTGQVSMGLKYEYENNFRGGIRYTDSDGWSAIKDFEEVKNELTFIRPEAKVKAEAGIGIYLGMDVMIYGVAGPEVAVGPRLGAEAEMTVSPFADSFDEKLNFNAEVGLTMNAVVGAKLKLLGYELAEYTKTIHLAGPWTLWKYPSDGSEHKCGENEEQRLFNMYEVKWMETYTDYSEQLNWIIKMMTEMRHIDDKQAHMMVRDMIIERMKQIHGAVVNNCQTAIDCMVEYKFELLKEYDAYEYQKHAEAGDTAWCNAKNWNDICVMLQRDYKGEYNVNILESVRNKFFATFKRQPTMSKEDVTWIADQYVNYRKYEAERQQKEAQDRMAVEANINKRFAHYKAQNATIFNQVLNDIDRAFRLKYDCPSTPNDERVYQLFESIVSQLIEEDNYYRNITDDWNVISRIVIGKVSNYFDYDQKRSTRLMMQMQTMYIEEYGEAPTSSKESIQRAVDLFKKKMKEMYRIVL